jgi:hypothetical protein
MLYQSHFIGEHVSMNKRGRTRMLLVLLLPWQAFGNVRNRSIGPLVSVNRTVGSAGSRRKRQTIKALTYTDRDQKRIGPLKCNSIGTPCREDGCPIFVIRKLELTRVVGRSFYLLEPLRYLRWHSEIKAIGGVPKLRIQAASVL